MRPPLLPHTQPARPSAVLALCAVVLTISLTSARADDSAETHSTDKHHHPALQVDAELSLAALLAHTAAHEGGAPVVAALRREAEHLQNAALLPFPDRPAFVAGYTADGFGSSDDGYRSARAGIELPLWWPFQRQGRRALANAAAATADGANAAHLLEVAAWLRAGLAELALADAHLELAQRAAESRQALVTKIERAVALEELAERELLLARNAALEARFAVLEALEEHKHAEDSYVLLTGIDRRPAHWHETAAARERFDAHPVLLQARAQAARTRADIDRIERERWGHPVLSVGSEHERDQREPNFNDRFAVGVRIPLGSSADAGSQLAAAQRQASETDRDLARLERDLRQQLAESEHRYSLSRERTKITSEQYDLTREHLRLTQRAFDLGEIDLETLLRAGARALAAERNHREAEIGHQANIAQRNQALGVLP